MSKVQIPLYDQALKYLNIKLYSYAELKERLLRKGYDSEEVREVLDQLVAEGLINDRLYAETFLRNLISYRGFGYYGIRNKLIQKKLDRGLVDQLLKKSVTSSVEEDLALRFLKKPVNAGRSKESLISALKTKGFRTDAIIKVLRELK